MNAPTRRASPLALIRRHNDGGWLLFEDPARIYTTTDPRNVPSLLEQVERDRAGGHDGREDDSGGRAGGGAGAAGDARAAVYALAYEAATGFDSALVTREPAPGTSIAWCALFERWRFVSDEETAIAGAPVWTDDRPVLFGRWVPELSAEAYGAGFREAKGLLEAGQTYQINYTQRFRAALLEIPSRDQLLGLFLHLVRETNAQYAAFVFTGDSALLSVSPELFFERAGASIRSRPMKGTIRRGAGEEEDDALAAQLQGSQKDRAENLMIVDMIRNDLGKRARIGSVQVPDLFAIERYPGLHQMTSQVVAESDATEAELLADLFPCASITGAPKVAAMRAIRDLERSPRGFYTGTVGIALPGRYSSWNVAIRTLSCNLVSGEAEYGTGGGVVWDSEEESEYREMLLKAEVLRHADPRFHLIETMLVEPEGGVFLLDLHLARLERSAAALGFRFPGDRLRSEIESQVESIAAGGRAAMLRILLGREGEIAGRATPLDEHPLPSPLGVRVARQPVDSRDIFLRHKTTYRRVYEEALAAARDGSGPEASGSGPSAVDEVFLHNERGELTEGTITNIVLQFGDKSYTPAAEAGLLPGCYREHLLRSGRVSEAVLRIEDLSRCDAVWAVNSVRGTLPCRLVE